MAKGDWYYCLEHKKVEPYEGCRSADRLGPYPSAEAAEAALEIARARNEAWENDPRFRDDDENDESEEDDQTGSWNPLQG